MSSITINIQDNGYKQHAAAAMIAVFDAVAGLLFPGCVVDHFYYGAALDFADVRIPGFGYGHFSITSGRVGFGGYAAMPADVSTFERMTFNDSVYPGELLQIAADAGLHLYAIHGGDYPKYEIVGYTCAVDVENAMRQAAALFPDYDGITALGRVSEPVIKDVSETLQRIIYA
jgi:hypothetical protein